MRSSCTVLVVVVAALAFITIEVALVLMSQCGMINDAEGNDSQSGSGAKALAYPSRTNVSGIISSDTTWSESANPYVVTGSVLVNSGVTLTIEPGVVIKLESAKGIQIDGQLLALGTEDKPIVLTSIRDDSFGGDTNNDGNLTTPAAGDWNELLLTDSSIDAITDSEGNYYGGSIIEYVRIFYGGGQAGSGVVASVHTIWSNHFIAHSSISCSRTYGVFVGYEGITMIGCDVSYNADSGVHCHEANMMVLGCVLSHNGRQYPYGGGYGNGVDAFANYDCNHGVAWHIRGCNLTSNGAYGVLAQWNSWNYWFSGDISANSVAENGQGGIWIYSSYGGGSSLDISGNSVFANRGSAIHIEGAAYQVTSNLISKNLNYAIEACYCGATIRNNLIIYGTGGIHTYGYVYGSPAYDMSNNIFAENIGGTVMNIESPYSGAGDTLIHDNSFVRNTVSSGALLWLGDSLNSALLFTHNLVSQNANSTTPCESIAAGGLPAVNYNNLWGNSYDTELYNGNQAGGSHLDATNNWWGSAVDSQVQERIYDWTDDSSKGIVDYLPFSSSIRTDTPVSPPQHASASVNGDLVTVSWTPSPEPDVIGYKIYYDSDSGYPYGNCIDVGDTMTHAIPGISAQDGWCIAVSSYDSEADGIDDICEGHESWLSNEAILDVVAPTGSILINNGDQWTWSTVLVLNFTAFDATSGIEDMRLSCNLSAVGGGWGAWHNFTSSETYDVCVDGYWEGVRTVYVEFRDRVGLVSEPYSDSIILDFCAPTGCISINGGAGYTASASVTLSLLAWDNCSGVASMQFYQNVGGWYEYTDWESYSSTKSWTLTSGDGLKEVFVAFKDHLGNSYGSSYADTIILDTTAPTARGTCSLTGTGSTMNLNGADSWDYNGIAGWNWSFTYHGSVVTLVGCTPQFTFDTSGEYLVSLRVTDYAGNEANTAFTVTIASSAIDSIPPVANAGQNFRIVVGQTAHFSGAGSTDNTGIVSYEWSFGDGTVGNGSSVSHMYSTVGTYNVVLTVRDATNNTATDTIIITVTNPDAQPPTDGGNQGAGDEGLPVITMAIAAGVAVVAIVAVSYLLVRRRGQG